MKLYEYEGKEIFKLVGIPVPRGVVTDKPIKWDGKAIVKSQILEGGRGKKGLVRVTEDVYNTILELQKLGVSKFRAIQGSIAISICFYRMKVT